MASADANASVLKLAFGGKRLRLPRFRLGRMLGQAVLVVFSLLALYPLYYMVTTALKTPEDYFKSPSGLPLHPTFSSFRLAFQNGPFATWLENSAIVTSAATVLVLAISVPAAFALGRMRFFGSQGSSIVIAALLGVPPVVLLLPLFVLFSDLNLVDKLTGISLVYAGLLAPFSIYLMTGFAREITQEMIDAAIVDGAKPRHVLRYIVLPLIRPAAVTTAIIVALSVWNELLFALVFLQSDDHKTVMAALTLFESRALTNQPLIMAGTLVATVPMVVVYVIGFRFFQRGLTAGAFR